MTLQLRDASWKVGGKAIISEISVAVTPGEFLGLIGPNGSGKTSLLSILAGIRKPSGGQAVLNDICLSQISRRDIARQIGFVEQQGDTRERITVRDAVCLGRTPYLSLLSPWSQSDDGVVENAMAAVEVTHLADRLWHTLSGGEKQRVHIARALAQEPAFLVLDEPTNHLDIRHQLGLLGLVRDLPVTVVAALHDLNHAAMFCDRLVVMDQGKIVGIGTPAEVLTRETLRTVFGVEADIDQQDNGRCLIRYRQIA
jgi:iron complex transport system ATP-binding protein